MLLHVQFIDAHSDGHTTVTWLASVPAVTDCLIRVMAILSTSMALS